MQNNDKLLFSILSALLQWSSSAFDRSVTDSTGNFLGVKEEKHETKKLVISD